MITMTRSKRPPRSLFDGVSHSGKLLYGNFGGAALNARYADDPGVQPELLTQADMNALANDRFVDYEDGAATPPYTPMAYNPDARVGSSGPSAAVSSVVVGRTPISLSNGLLLLATPVLAYVAIGGKPKLPTWMRLLFGATAAGILLNQGRSLLSGAGQTTVVDYTASAQEPDITQDPDWTEED